MVTSYLRDLDEAAQTAHSFIGTVSLCNASVSNETAYGFSNFGDIAVHKFCKNEELTSFDGLVTLKCYIRSDRSVCEIAVNQENYPKIVEAREITLEIGDLSTAVPLHNEVSVEIDGVDTVIRRFWLYGEDTDLFKFVKDNVGEAYSYRVSW